VKKPVSKGAFLKWVNLRRYAEVRRYAEELAAKQRAKAAKKPEAKNPVITVTDAHVNTLAGGGGGGGARWLPPTQNCP
jgi:hypothetical protein